MSLFISNSKGRQALYITLTLLALLGGAERLVRWQFHSDIKFARRFLRQQSEKQEMARSLNAFSGTRILLLGNSLCRGISATNLQMELQTNGISPVRLEKHVESGTSIHYWHWWLDNTFWKPGLKADWIVIPFLNYHLEDEGRLEMDGLEQLAVLSPGAETQTEFEFTSIPKRLHSFVATHWKTYVLRKQIKKLVLVTLVPGYANYMTDVNNVNFEHTQAATIAKHPKAGSYNALRQFVQRAREVGARVCFVAYPARPTVGETLPEMPPEMTQLITNSGVSLIDLRNVPELTRDKYQDRAHLKVNEIPLWTHILGLAVAAHLKEERQRAGQQQ